VINHTAAHSTTIDLDQKRDFRSTARLVNVCHFIVGPPRRRTRKFNELAAIARAINKNSAQVRPSTVDLS
jgi:hypothetical protein